MSHNRPATVDDYMHLASVMAQRLAEYLYDHEDGKGKEACDAYVAARTALKCALVSGVVELTDGVQPCAHPADKLDPSREPFIGTVTTCKACGARWDGRGNAVGVKARCGYCGQDMVPGSECTTSASADKCSMYQEFAATRQVNAGVSGIPPGPPEGVPPGPIDPPGGWPKKVA